MEPFEINGEQWRLKPQKTSPSLLRSRALMSIITMSAAFGGGLGIQRDEVDLIREYELIQRKKSNLSRSQRDAVVRHFERRFEKIN